MTTVNFHQALHTKLLGDERIGHGHGDGDDKESISRVLANANQIEDKNDAGTVFGVRAIYWDVLFLVVIYCDMAWSILTTPPTPAPMTASRNLPFITMSIASFGLSTFSYRLTCADCPKSIKNHVLFHTLVLASPEILTNIVIFNLFILGNNNAALVALHCGSQLLSTVALAGTIRFLFFSQKRLPVEQEEEKILESSRQVTIFTA
jgi:hypothetical protein